MNNKYTIIKQESIEELNGTGYILKHDKTGARVVVISNEDDNKVFQIGFRTPPKDDTGVPHILEHSVLCGSREFPMKDPFVELVKGSLNTFLNAMTYPDKTVYPVASQNDKDFFNLVHVYLDAVFYPNIYKKPEILKQEGWHYDLLNEDAPLTYNGVVFNEMKGVFSSPDQQLARIIQKSLLEDTPYGFESGGDPKAIPDLTYEMFLDFHKTYYHPSNSYIYLYGDMDVDEYLTFIDEHYLKDFDKKQIDSSWEKQEPFTEVKRVEEYYPVGENDSEEEKTYLSYNAVIGDSLDAKLYLGFEILNRVLFDAPGAPVKKALMDAQIGKELFKLTVRIQCTTDYVNHGQTVHRFSFVQTLQIDVIKTILRVQHVNHSFFDGLNHHYTAVEISFFVHVVDNPVNKRTKEITFAKLNNSFRTDRFLCGLFV